MTVDNNRLLLELEQEIRRINREIINPIIPELKVSDIEPIMELVARARASYLKELFDITKIAGDGLPSPDQVRQLGELRNIYEELLTSSKALETAIQRCYLDVVSE